MAEVSSMSSYRHNYFKAPPDRMGRSHSGARKNRPHNKCRKNNGPQTYPEKGTSEQFSEKPAFLRLDSTGESPLGSASEDSNTHSPQSEPSPGHLPQFQGSSNWGYRMQSRKPRENQQANSHQQWGLLNKVSSALNHNPNPGSRRFFVQPRTKEPDSSLATLDFVAEKFTGMSCSMMRRDPESQGGGGGGGMRQFHDTVQSWDAGPMGHQPQPQNYGNPGRTVPPRWGGLPQNYHPYVGVDQSRFTQNYRRTCFHQPWQQLMGRPQPFVPQFHGGLYQQAFNQPLMWQQPYYPPQRGQGTQWLGHFNMMPNRCNGQSGQRHNRSSQSPQRNRSYNTKNNYGSKRACREARSKVASTTDAKVSSPISQSLPTCSEGNPGSDNTSSLLSSPCPMEAESLPSMQAESLALMQAESQPSESTEACLESPKSDDVTSAINSTTCQSSFETTGKERDNEKQSSSNVTPDEHLSMQSNDTVDMKDSEGIEQDGTQCEEITTFVRHSSIELILSEYQSQTGSTVDDVSLSADSDFSDVAGEISGHDGSDIWESFAPNNDPYNPLSGWRCTQDEITLGQSLGFKGDEHIDSGTDEGDDWSGTDADEESESSDEDDGDGELVNACRSESFELTVQQLKNLERNLSSTPKDKIDLPLHRSSVAFVLGSSSSSEDDEDDNDDDWDTIEDPSSLRDDPLWDSFNKSKDPYSPMNAWRCSDPGVSVAGCPLNNLGMDTLDGSMLAPESFRRDSVAKLRSARGADSNEHILSRERTASRDSLSSENSSFTISTVHIYGAKDDMDCHREVPKMEDFLIKRVASASCLRSAQRIPELKVMKKVRFSPSSSFIVLVEREGTLPGDGSGTDWQTCARDRLRFRDRINETAASLDPIFTQAHRERVYQTRFILDADR